MKKTLFLALVLMTLCFPLFAGEYKANSLGQNIQGLALESSYLMKDVDSQGAFKPEILGIDLEDFEVSSRVLYKDDVPFQRFDTYTKDDVLAEVVSDLPSGKLARVSCYEKGFLKFYADQSGSVECFYDQNLLSRSVRRNGEKMEGTDFYYRSLSNNLAMVRSLDLESGNDLLISDSFLYEDGKLITKEATLDLQNQGFSAEKKDGALVITSIQADGTSLEKTLDEKGFVILLVRKDKDREIYREEYFYSDKGILVSSVKTQGNICTRSEYKDGKVIREEKTQDGELVSVNQYEGDLKIQTLYEYGQPYAEVTYDELNGKIKKVKYW